MQIQTSFGDLPLAEVARSGLRIYLLLPDFKNTCPLCDGANCAVRHGLYHRTVVDVDGSEIERFPIARFRCRRLGRRQPAAVTFSVLPTALVPRRRFSLPLMLLILELVRRQASIPMVLDRLAVTDSEARGALLVEEAAVYRVIALFARAYLHLGKKTSHGMQPGSGPGGSRARALALAGMIVEDRGPPDGAFTTVLRFHRRFFPRMLLDVHTA